MICARGPTEMVCARGPTEMVCARGPTEMVRTLSIFQNSPNSSGVRGRGEVLGRNVRERLKYRLRNSEQ